MATPQIPLDWLTPKTGSAHPEDARVVAAVAAATKFDTHLVPHPAHARTIAAFDRARLAGIAAGDGRRMAISCLGPSGSGKTTAMRTFQRQTAAGRPPVGRHPAEPVVIIQVDNGCTNRRLWALVLEAHQDPPGKGTEETFRARAYATMRRAGTEMVIFDEVQHLLRSPNARDVTDTIKRILDDGVVTLGLVGTEQARPLLTRNIQLANRMLAPADLKPLDHRLDIDRKDFQAFVGQLDDAIINMNLMVERAGLDDQNIVRCLFVISGGVVGVVVNLLRQVLMHAVARGANRIEPYDLSQITDSWAIATGVCHVNPFRQMLLRAGGAG